MRPPSSAARGPDISRCPKTKRLAIGLSGSAPQRAADLRVQGTSGLERKVRIRQGAGQVVECQNISAADIDGRS